MENELSFERKISFEPLMISLFLGAMVAAIFYSIFPKYPLIGVMLGLVSFILEVGLVYPRYLSNSYGYWKINDQGIYYYDYSTWSKCMRAIFLPSQEKFQKLSFSNIKNFSIIDGKSIMNTQEPLGGSLRAPLARKIHCLVIETNHQKIKLNCAWTAAGIPTTSADIKKIVTLINSKMS